jgi:hypothetical protein
VVVGCSSVLWDPWMSGVVIFVVTVVDVARALALLFRR